MPIRQTALDFINEVIVDNQGSVSTEDTIVRESGIDSFGFSLIFLELDDEFDCFDNEFIKTISNEDLLTLTIKDLIDRIEECS